MNQKVKTENVEQVSVVEVSAAASPIAGKVRAYAQLLKFRLSFLVALSAVFGFAMAGMAAGTPATAIQLVVIGLGGLMITGASNVLNQIIEKDLDALMTRTKDRPMPTARLNNAEALVYAMVLAIAGIAMIGYFFNLPAALLGIIGLLSYAFVYTPLKRISPISVFVGAIPGALPPLIGWVAFTGSITTGGMILLAFQFFWQFPHFWAIAWNLDEDYQKAGFKMLPSASGRSKFTAMIILIYTLCLMPLVFFPVSAGMIGVAGAAVLVGLGALFSWPAWKLYKTNDSKYAKQLMFASFIYLPFIQLTFLIG